MKKIAIVTPEIAGLYKTGGIGTNYFSRARFLSRDLQKQVTFLFTGSCSATDLAKWREHYAQMGIGLELLPTFSAKSVDSFYERALAVHRWLAAGDWDEIHFPEYFANGFICIQAKRAGLAYQNTRLVVTMHSSSLWCREAMQMRSLDAAADARLDYAERYCCENADTLISPSHYMVRWAENKGWRLPPDRIVLPTLFEKPEGIMPVARPANPRHLIFFGRLETRKGLGIFCEAIGHLVKSGRAPLRVDFLGRVGSHEERPADEYIRKLSSQWVGVETRLHTDFDCFEAIKYLRETNGLVVVASLYDNFPNTVIECVGNEIPFIATNGGGIPEIADAAVLFAPDAISLAAKIEAFAASPPTQFNHPYKFADVRQAWKEFVETPFKQAAVPSVSLPTKISVCVSVGNHARRLAETLAALQRQTYENFEVIMVADDSADADSLAHFEQAQKEYRSFQFFKPSGLGTGAAKNFAATQAVADLLVFVDAGTLPTEQMLKTFVRALQVSGADCATCYFESSDNRCDLFGPCLEAGWRTNVLGGVNFIVKKNVFEAVGGFATDRNSVEGWQFLLHLNFKGFHQILIPENLYQHESAPVGPDQHTDKIRAARIIMETYREGMSAWPARLIEDYVFGPYLRSLIESPLAVKEGEISMPHDARKNFVRKLQNSTVKRLMALAGFISRL